MSFETYHKENAYGEVLYNTSRAFCAPLQGEEKSCPAGFKEMALIDGATEESSRKTSALLNRMRHQEDGGTPSRTIRETTERAGLVIQEHLEQKVCTIFHACGLTPKGQPPASIVDTLVPQPPLVAEARVHEVVPPQVRPEPCQIDICSDLCADEDGQEAVETAVAGVVIQALHEVVAAQGLSAPSRLDMLKNPVSYEDPQDAVKLSIDDVGAKKQKATREPQPQGPPAEKKRAYVPNTVMHVAQGGQC